MTTLENHLDTFTVPNYPIYISSIENTSSFLVGFSGTTGVLKYSSNTIGCDENCKSCVDSTAYDCKSCFMGYSQDQPGVGPFFCKKDCDLTSGVYYDLSTNDCMPCVAGCQQCNRERDIDCTLCELTHWKQPNNACETGCLVGTYPNPDLTKTCLSCHPSCKTCSGSSNLDCILCADGLLENTDGTCTPTCKAGTYDVTPTSCANCHSSCKKCDGPNLNHCTECHNTTLEFLNSNRICVNCLDDYLTDMETCNFTRPLRLARCPYESKDPFSSLTIKLQLDNFEEYAEILDKKMDWGQDMFSIRIKGLEGEQLSLGTDRRLLSDQD